MHGYFTYRRDEFMAHYHHRSNVESTFSMIKRKFGDSLRTKTDTAMVNEVLCDPNSLAASAQEPEGVGIFPGNVWGRADF